MRWPARRRPPLSALSQSRVKVSLMKNTSVIDWACLALPNSSEWEQIPPSWHSRQARANIPEYLEGLQLWFDPGWWATEEFELSVRPLDARIIRNQSSWRDALSQDLEESDALFEKDVFNVFGDFQAHVSPPHITDSLDDVQMLLSEQDLCDCPSCRPCPGWEWTLTPSGKSQQVGQVFKKQKSVWKMMSMTLFSDKFSLSWAREFQIQVPLLAITPDAGLRSRMIKRKCFFQLL